MARARAEVYRWRTSFESGPDQPGRGRVAMNGAITESPQNIFRADLERAQPCFIDHSRSRDRDSSGEYGVKCVAYLTQRVRLQWHGWIAIGETAIAKQDYAALRDYYASGYVLHLARYPEVCGTLGLKFENDLAAFV